MKIFEQLRQWMKASDEEKVALDRRAFLKGMTVTSAGLLVPGAAVFDMGRRSLASLHHPFEVVDEIAIADVSDLEDFHLHSFDLVEKPVTPGAQLFLDKWVKDIDLGSRLMHVARNEYKYGGWPFGLEKS